MALTLAYDGQLSRVRISVDGLSDAAVVRVERSTDQIRWSTVRGGVSLTPSGGEIRLDDYEFAPNVPNIYRAVVSGAVVGSAQITPHLDRPWIKSIARPFLNRPLPMVEDISPITRPARAGVFDVQGRSFPVAVSSVRGSRQWNLTVLTEGLDEARTLDRILASGDVLLLQVPPGSNTPAGYVTVGDSTEQRFPGQGGNPGEPRRWTLPLTEVAPPGPEVVGATVTWQSVINAYATWADVIAAHDTWASVAELIGDPEDVIVP